MRACSWCHRTNPTSLLYCECGHMAQRSRMECYCPTCREPKTQVVIGNDYGILRLSPRRYAIVRRKIFLSRKLVGYGKVEKYPDRLGAKLSEPRFLENHLEYEIVEGFDKLDYNLAVRALYQLTHPPEA